MAASVTLLRLVGQILAVLALAKVLTLLGASSSLPSPL